MHICDGDMLIKAIKQIVQAVENSTGLPYSYEDKCKWADGVLIMIRATISCPPSTILKILDGHFETQKRKRQSRGIEQEFEGMTYVRNAALRASQKESSEVYLASNGDSSLPWHEEPEDLFD